MGMKAFITIGIVVFLLAVLFSVLLFFNDNFIPIVHEYGDDVNCPEGETGRYEFTGVEFILMDCKHLPLDYQEICSSNDECEFNCVASREDMEELECGGSECQGVKNCEGILGRCAPYGVESLTVIEEGKVNDFCHLKKDLKVKF
jgi:hypothetical protein